MTDDRDSIHRGLVDRLTHDLLPIGGRFSPRWWVGCWSVVALGTVAIAAAVGLRQDLTTQLARPAYVATLALLLIGAGFAATAALLAAVPGRIAGHRAEAIAIGVLVLAVASALLGDPPRASSVIAFELTGLRCTACVAAFAFLPGLVLFRALRRGAPLNGWATGLCAGAAACLVGAASVRVACPFDDMGHLALWHGLPVVFWATASAAAGAAWLTQWLARSTEAETPG